ncbi:MAG: hypothetical protein KDB03_20620 [Planctomycetales bacterium]|nr:hypothetical protein [Planctomycetales bacterium]
MTRDLNELIPQRHGHFEFESGHHGDTWLDLELLFQRPSLIRPHAERLADAIRQSAVEVICGPLVEGAFVGQMVAEALDVEFVYTTPEAKTTGEGLFPVVYRLPSVARSLLKGKRMGIVNDVINAGSSVRGTLDELHSIEAVPVAIATLMTLGDAAEQLSSQWELPLLNLAHQEIGIWTPEECPLCRDGIGMTAS